MPRASGGLEKPRDWEWTSKFKWPLLGPHAPPAHPRDAQQRQEEDGEQEEPAGAERSQEEPDKQTGLPH